ncbi:MAG: helix-turn-helix domain-containing protein [Clostridium sp.]|nr:helix-turn-helix domain-containing protein [Clostridium sp.]
MSIHKKYLIEKINYPVKAYLIKLRLFLASQMLAETSIPVSEVINRVGFNDVVHFSRIFRKNSVIHRRSTGKKLLVVEVVKKFKKLNNIL